MDVEEVGEGEEEVGDGAGVEAASTKINMEEEVEEEVSEVTRRARLMVGMMRRVNPAMVVLLPTINPRRDFPHHRLLLPINHTHTPKAVTTEAITPRWWNFYVDWMGSNIPDITTLNRQRRDG